MTSATLSLSTAGPGRKMRAGIFAGVALLALGVYANSIGNGFALDDVGIVAGHPSVQEHEWIRIWGENYWPCPEGAPDLLYRPLTIFSYLCNHALAANVAWSYHAVNVALHMLVSVMVTLLAVRLLANWGAAAIAGALFALHPLHTEVVANVVGRAELLAATWTLLALLIYLPAKDVLAGRPEKRAWWHGGLVAMCMLLAMLAKETPAAMLAAFGILDVWRWSNWRDRPRLWAWLRSQSVRYYLPLAVAAGVYGAMRINAVGLGSGGSLAHPVVNPLVAATLAERIVTPFMLLGKYLTLLAWPARLSSDYSAPSLMPVTNLANPGVLMGLLVVVLGLVVVVTRWRQWPRAALLIVLFVASYALVANALLIGTIFGERLFYWPSVFVLMLAGYVLALGWERAAELPTRRNVRIAGALAMAAVCVAMGTRTVLRNPDWKENLNLALATARDNPGSAKACYWAGSVLVTQSPASKPEWIDLGVRLLKDSVEMRPDFGHAYYELAKYYGRQHQFGESFIWLCRAARFQGGLWEMRMTLREVKKDLLREKPEEYVPIIEKYLAENDRDPCAYLALGMVRAATDKLQEADDLLARGLELDPRFVELRAEYGLLKEKRGDLESAFKHLKMYNLVVHFNVEARVDLARVLMNMDPKVYPFAMAEADMNLTRAAGMFYADSRVRAARAEWNRRKSELGAGRPAAAPAAEKDHAAQPADEAIERLLPLGMAR